MDFFCQTRCQEHKANGAKYVIIVCDEFSYEDYTVPVMPDEDIDVIKAKYDGKNMQKIMEVIDLDSVPYLEERKNNG